MSILPPRTSPTPSTAAPAASHVVTSFADDLAWTIQWAVRLRTPSETAGGVEDQAIIDAQLFARLTGSSIELGLRTASGDSIQEQCLSAAGSTWRTSSGTVIDWTTAAPGTRIRTRLLIADGQEPVLRTNLPSLLGIRGGRYDLARISPNDPPNVAGRISGDS